ncbi:MAG: Uma2 family endonuclease [Candidatus Brocadia sp.]|jgi:Uma2 family endonuclease
MNTIATKKIWTEKELMSLPKEGYKCELIQGKLVMGPAGIEHEEIGANLLTALRSFVSERKLGIVCGSSAGYWMKSGNLRSPDVSFIRKERLQGYKRPPKGFFKGSPDIAIEILSPTDTVESLHGKIVEYFENDTKLAWVVNPEEQTVLIYHSPQPSKLLTKNDLLDGEEILKGFTFPIAELFAEI